MAIRHFMAITWHFRGKVRHYNTRLYGIHIINSLRARKFEGAKFLAIFHEYEHDVSEDRSMKVCICDTIWPALFCLSRSLEHDKLDCFSAIMQYIHLTPETDILVVVDLRL